MVECEDNLVTGREDTSALLLEPNGSNKLPICPRESPSGYIAFMPNYYFGGISQRNPLRVATAIWVWPPIELTPGTATAAQLSM
jgi:hypothetical protein